MQLTQIEDNIFYLPHHKLLQICKYTVNKPYPVPDYKLKDIALLTKEGNLIGYAKYAFIERKDITKLTTEYHNPDLSNPNQFHVLNVIEYQ